MKTTNFFMFALALVAFTSTASFGFRPPGKPHPRRAENEAKRKAEAEKKAQEEAQKQAEAMPVPPPVVVAPPVAAPPVVENDHGKGSAEVVNSLFPFSQQRPVAPAEEVLVKLATSINDAKSLVCHADGIRVFINMDGAEVKSQRAYDGEQQWIGSNKSRVLIQRHDENDISFETVGDVADANSNGASYGFVNGKSIVDPTVFVDADKTHTKATARIRFEGSSDKIQMSCNFYQSEVSPKSKLEEPKVEEKKAEEVKPAIDTEKAKELIQSFRSNLEEKSKEASDALKAFFSSKK